MKVIHRCAALSGEQSVLIEGGEVCPFCSDRMPIDIEDTQAVPSALRTQVGGGHYKAMKIQPLEYCHANNVGKIEGDVIAYVSRWKLKGGVEDLKKARHELDILIELEMRDATTGVVNSAGD